MFVGHILKGKSVDGYVRDGLVDTRILQQRHDLLAVELELRGYNHRSPMDYIDQLGVGTVHIENSYRELAFRCPDCRQRIKEYGVLSDEDLPESVNYSSVAYEHARKINPRLTRTQYISTLQRLG